MQELVEIVKRDQVEDGGRDAARVDRLYADELMRFATGLVGRDVAEDVLAQAVVKALSAKSWSTLTNPRAYLYRAVSNEANRWRRRAAIRAAVESDFAGSARQVEAVEPRPDVAAAVVDVGLPIASRVWHNCVHDK